MRAGRSESLHSLLMRSAFWPDLPLLKTLRLLHVPLFHLLRLLRVPLLHLLLSGLILLLAGLILLLPG